MDENISHGFSVGYITEEEAQEALLQFVTQSCCYGKSAAKEMEIYRINPSSALHVSHYDISFPLLFFVIVITIIQNLIF